MLMLFPNMLYYALAFRSPIPSQHTRYEIDQPRSTHVASQSKTDLTCDLPVIEDPLQIGYKPTQKVP